ncbi:c-type cytochrome [Sphingomonas sp. FW199]|uniref:c-type cytochrome n=1 Tax=Sphingomonas sp. FW199 TaxID=3400217 RepID=UPI003CF406FE
MKKTVLSGAAIAAAMTIGFTAASQGGATQAQPGQSGQTAFAQCRACHTVNKGGANGVGPNLNGVVGRKAASVAGFNYSPALKKSGITWTEAKLDAYLANPAATVPGTKMVIRVNDANKRAAIIAYLKAEAAK